MKSPKYLIAAAAITGLLAGAASRSMAFTAPTTSASPTSQIKAAPETSGLTSVLGTQTFARTFDAHDCKGKNACKGQGGCKTGDNGCKGKNSCKAKGGCKTPSI